MEWVDFVNQVYFELKQGKTLFSFGRPLEKEQDLTKEIVKGLRKFVIDNQSVQFKELPYYVLSRQGETPEERLAWNQCQSEKWILFHGVRFVPDILIRRTLDDTENILPIEVKLIKDAGSGQGIATAIGQSLIYGVRYPQTIMFVGIKRSIKWGKYQLSPLSRPVDIEVYRRLGSIGIRLVLREVGE